MKKFVTIMLIVMLFSSFYSCGSVQDSTQDSTQDSSYNPDSKDETFETEDIYAEKYEKAQEYIDNGNYEAAYELYKELGSYKDCAERLGYFRYVVTEVDFKYNEVLKFNAVFSFNDQNLPFRIITDEEHDGTEEGTSIIDIDYDKNGDAIKQVWTYYDGDKRIEDRTYDADRNLIQRIYTYDDGSRSIDDYTYDINGNLIKEVCTYHDGDKSIRDYTYDANGTLIKEVYTYHDGDKSICDYTYDENVNLIKRVCSYVDSYNVNVFSELNATYKLVYIPFDLSPDVEEWIDVMDIIEIFF